MRKSFAMPVPKGHGSKQGPRRWPSAAVGTPVFAALLLGLQLASAVADEQPAAAGEGSAQAAAEGPYTVKCEVDAESGAKECHVDKETFVGWRMYHSFCHVCHAQDAVGSTFAPSLVERLQIIDKERFLDAVANGYTGQIGVMPPWKDNPNISKRYEEIYAYLKARSDGALPGGRPKKIKEPK